MELKAALKIAPPLPEAVFELKVQFERNASAVPLKAMKCNPPPLGAELLLTRQLFKVSVPSDLKMPPPLLAPLTLFPAIVQLESVTVPESKSRPPPGPANLPLRIVRFEMAMLPNSLRKIRKSGVPAAVLRSIAAPLPLMVRRLPPSVAITGRPFASEPPPLSTVVRTYRPSAARLIVSV